jgi:hypothetical protein
MNARSALSTWATLDNAQHAQVPAYREPNWPMIRVRCLLAFMHEGRRVDPGEEIDLVRPLANCLIARRRAELK